MAIKKCTKIKGVQDQLDLASSLSQSVNSLILQEATLTLVSLKIQLSEVEGKKATCKPSNCP